MKIIYSALLKFVLESFMKNEDNESIKEKLAQKMAQDSKDLIFAVTAANISLMLVMTSCLIGLYSLLSYFNFTKVEMLSYLSLAALFLAVLVGFLSVRYIRIKTKVYTDISIINKNVKKANIFESLINQIKFEQHKMKNNIHYNDSKFIQ